MAFYPEIEWIYDFYLKSEGVCTDSRIIKEKQIFFALSGEKFNGHSYIDECLSKGAMLVVGSESRPDLSYTQYMQVPDSLICLQQLATYRRLRWKCPVFAITGSNGKTTTKELLAAILSKKFQLIFTPGNWNNHIGLPLTMLQHPKMKPDFVLLELGDNHPNEIAALCQIACPTEGCITNIGRDHLGNYQSFEENVATKMELYDYLKSTNGIFWSNQNDLALQNKKIYRNAKTFGNMGDYDASLLSNHLGGVVVEVKNKDKSWQLSSSLSGAYNQENILIAFAVAHAHGVHPEQIISAIAEFQPQNNRSQFLNKGKVNIILDAYNANLSSMMLSIQSFVEVAQGKSALILGEMNELGSLSTDDHASLGDFIQPFVSQLHGLFCIGESCKTVLEHAKFSQARWYPNVKELKNDLALIQEMDSIFIKGSRTNQLEKIIEWL